MARIVLLAAAFAAALTLGSAQAQSPGTLKKIADARSITLGYRTEAAPFSFAAADGQPAGYSVDLCKRVVAGLEQQPKTTLAIKWVPVTSENFVDGGSFVTRADGPRKLADLAGKTVGVLAGTTTETRLREVLKARMIDARLLTLRDEREGVAALADGRIQAFANDRIALVGRVLVAQPAGVTFALGEDDFSFEPYALMMRRDPAFRLAVNRALAQIYAGPAIGEVYDRWFGKVGKPTPLLLAMYYLATFGE